MSVILVFLLVIVCISGWWLAQQRIFSKPWLEQGVAVAGAGPTGVPTAKIGLAVLLAVIGCLFALFASAFFMRMEYADWRAPPLPGLVWFNTLLLLAASAAHRLAADAARSGRPAAVREALLAGAVLGAAFLAGQLMVWRQLADGGYALQTNPANGFFYLLTGMHGLHILGGLAASAWAMARAREGDAAGEGDVLRVELCATYWHFLLFVWLGLVVLLAGWAGDLLALCRQVLA